MISIFVRGIPITKGSVKPFLSARGKTFADDARLGAWSDTVAWQVKAALARAQQACADLPMELRLLFVLPREVLTRPTLKHPAGRTVTHERAYPDIAPDLDKLDRAVGDALNRIVYKDDGRVVARSSAKIYVGVDGYVATGVEVRFRPARDLYWRTITEWGRE